MYELWVFLSTVETNVKYSELTAPYPVGQPQPPKDEILPMSVFHVK